MVQQQALSLSLFLPFSACTCVYVCRYTCSVFYQCFLVISDHHFDCTCPCLQLYFETSCWCFSEPGSNSGDAHTLTHSLSIQLPANPIPDPSASHAASLNSVAVSARLFPSPSQHRPRASRDQHSHPPPLTAALCQATCLARVEQGVARRLDNSFCQWSGVRIRLGDPDKGAEPRSCSLVS